VLGRRIKLARSSRACDFYASPGRRSPTRGRPRTLLRRRARVGLLQEDLELGNIPLTLTQVVQQPPLKAPIPSPVQWSLGNLGTVRPSTTSSASIPLRDRNSTRSNHRRIVRPTIGATYQQLEGTTIIGLQQ
jgi:hypothetical protein